MAGCAPRDMIAVTYAAGPDFNEVSRERLFDSSPYLTSGGPWHAYAVSRDAQRFMMIRSQFDAERGSRLVVVHNLFEELERIVSNQKACARRRAGSPSFGPSTARTPLAPTGGLSATRGPPLLHVTPLSVSLQPICRRRIRSLGRRHQVDSWTRAERPCLGIPAERAARIIREGTGVSAVNPTPSARCATTI
jgi:hypothetical protein